MNMEEIIINQLIQNKLTLATAESCTGGLISHRLTNVPGASAVFMGGIVAYSNEAKKTFLGVSESTLSEFGAVSDPVAQQMAIGVCKQLQSDIGIGVTGIAGPTGGSPEKPVGLVYISVACPSRKIQVVKKYLFNGTRVEIKQQTSETALQLLLETINSITDKGNTYEL